MDRQTFINSIWDPYPTARAGWVDVGEFSKTLDISAAVCGRLKHIEGESWSLASAGHELEFLLGGDDVTWLLPTRSGVAEDRLAFPPARVLRDGDLVAVRFKENYEKQHRPLRASACALLAPSQGLKPSRPSASFARSREWMEFISEVRDFFRERGFVEVLTPTLVPSPGTEPFLDPFQTEIVFGDAVREIRYLPTSPEFHLKKMLAAGWTKIFEIKTCFRNGEAGAHHQPEFQMLEWYRAYATLDAIADDVAALLGALIGRFRGSTVPVALERTTMTELFARAFPGFTLGPGSSRAELATLARNSGVRIEESDTWDEIFFRLFLERIEPELGLRAPVLVRDYPASQAALSRIGKSGFADRFEVYWRGLEIANAFHELNDPEENAARFADDAAKKRQLGKPAVPVDSELLESLRFGFPPSGGIALGLERLFMALFEIDSIDEVKAFPYERS